MRNVVFRTLIRWVEVIIHLIVPITAAVVAFYPNILQSSSRTETMIRLILGLLAGITVADMLARYITLHNIEEETRKLSELSNLSLLRSAQESGVVDLFARADQHRLGSIVESINNSTGPIDLCGVALTAMIEDDDFKKAVLESSKRNDVRVLLLKPDSFEAQRRARIETPLGTKTIIDIEGTQSWIQKQLVNNRRFRLHFYETPPMLSLIITDQFVFMEPYHFGRPEGVEGCIGGKVPMLKIRNMPEMGIKNSYLFFKEHFEYLWNFTKGTRVNLPIRLIEAKSSNYVILKNETGIDIEMSGWELSGQECRAPYQFDIEFKWPKDTTLGICQNNKAHPKADKNLYAHYNFMGNNTILRLINDPGILLNEWSIVHLDP
jgi:hypothetical protein